MPCPACMDLPTANSGGSRLALTAGLIPGGLLRLVTLGTFFCKSRSFNNFWVLQLPVVPSQWHNLWVCHILGKWLEECSFDCFLFDCYRFPHHPVLKIHTNWLCVIEVLVCTFVSPVLVCGFLWMYLELFSCFLQMVPAVWAGTWLE